jgi:GT2 family glycosyltransferase
VDASPDDETESVLRNLMAAPRLAACIQYYRVTVPLKGLTRQRNFALRQVSTDLVAFFDDDVVLSPGCLGEMEQAHRSHGNAVAGIGALIMNELSPPGLLWRLRRSFHIVPNLQPGIYHRSGMSIPWGFLTPTNAMIPGSYLPGCAMMWKTAAARQIGFNEFFDGYANGEDLEFSLRMGQTGTLMINGKARVQHFHEMRGRPNAYEMGYMTIRNAYYIHRTCLRNRTGRDTFRFAYAYGVDALIQSANLLRPDRALDTARYLIGYLRFITRITLSGPRTYKRVA